jgi:acetyl/propionyl-CoA carboxylase alpha subunit
VFIGPPATAITSMGSKRSVPSFTLSLPFMKSAKISVNRRTSCLVCGCERNVVQATDEMDTAAAGVPCVPGYHGDNQDPEHLFEQASKIGSSHYNFL